jgi:Ig-like domain from next to BRCA1 gene
VKALRICFVGLMILVLLASCGAGANQPTASSPVPQSSNTSAPTVSKASTITPLPVPTHRLATPISFPTLTPLGQASFTPLPSLTSLPAGMALTIEANLTSIGGPVKPMQCKLISSDPEPGAFVDAGRDFVGVWHIRNTGTAAWAYGDTALFYVSGSKFQGSKYKEKFIRYIVLPGEQLNLRVEMKAPNGSGLYSTTWGLRSKKLRQFFCLFPLLIQIK